MGAKRTGRYFSFLVVGLGAFIAAGLLSIPLPCEARKIYQDKSGYFKFYPPPGWIQKGSSGGKKRRVRFASPDGKASILVNVRPVRPSEKTWENLLADKKAAQQKIKKVFPKSKVSLRNTTLAGNRSILIITEIPGTLMQENYLYVNKGLHFNLSFSAKRTQDFNRYKHAALVSFQTMEAGK